MLPSLYQQNPQTTMHRGVFVKVGYIGAKTIADKGHRTLEIMQQIESVLAGGDHA